MSWPYEGELREAVMSLLSKPTPSASRINAIKTIACEHHKVIYISFLLSSLQSLVAIS